MKLLKISMLLIFLSFFNNSFTLQAADTDKEISVLKIDKVQVIDTRTISLEFNIELKSTLEKGSEDIYIINSNDDLEEVTVKEYSIDWKKAEFLLENNLVLWGKYVVVVMSMEWINWEKINSWVDWGAEFEVSMDTKKYVEGWDEWLKSADGGLGTEESLSNNETLLTNVSKTLWWNDVVNNQNSLDSVAEEKSDLPQTGPWETLLFLIISLIAWWLFLSLRQRIKL